MKRGLLDFVRDRLRQRWAATTCEPGQAVACGALLDPEALTIGFARRFATYKRATLMFRDLGAAAGDLLDDTHRPVQIIFAGKAHPADEGGKELLQASLPRGARPRRRAGGSRSSRTTTCTRRAGWCRASTSGSTIRARRSRRAARAA